MKPSKTRFHSLADRSPPGRQRDQAGGAVFAAVAFLGVFGAAPVQPGGLRLHQRHALTGLILAFALGSFMNAWLLDFTPGHVYVVLLAWLMSERYRSNIQ